jgi:hypothetical protein
MAALGKEAALLLNYIRKIPPKIPAGRALKILVPIPI